MAQAFDERGQLLGAAEADTRTEALKRLLELDGIAEKVARIEIREQSVETTSVKSLAARLEADIVAQMDAATQQAALTPPKQA